MARIRTNAVRQDAESALTVASWLLVPQPEQHDSVEEALEGRPGIEYRGSLAGRLVVVTESPEALGLEPVRDELLRIPGVRDAALVAAFADREDEPWA